MMRYPAREGNPYLRPKKSIFNFDTVLHDGITIPVEDSGDSRGTGNTHMYRGTPECGDQERSRA